MVVPRNCTSLENKNMYDEAAASVLTTFVFKLLFTPILV